MSKILNRIRIICYEQFKGKLSEEEAFQKIKKILYNGQNLMEHQVWLCGEYYMGVDFAKPIVKIDTPFS